MEGPASASSNEPPNSPAEPITPGLVLVATPIGNLADLSPRAAAALRAADLVLCEDTRKAATLLRHHGIHTRTEALHDHNEAGRTPVLLRRMQDGARLALVSDAGTPLVSDPGYRLVRAAIDAGLHVSGIPGPNAAVMALTLSGLPPHPFLFVGFPPARAAARRSAFARLRGLERAGLSATLVWHEAPHRLADTLADLQAAFGPERPAAIARELTKRFEEVRRAPIADLAAWYAENPVRGEITLLLGPAPDEPADATTLDDRLREALQAATVRDAAAAVAAATGLPRRTVYARALELRSASG